MSPFRSATPLALLGAFALALCYIGTGGVADAKCRTGTIIVEGSGLSNALTVSDPDVVERFHIWNGPGVRVNDKPVHLDPGHQEGAFVDWPSGEVAKRPQGLTRYQVLFQCPGPATHGRYVVYYELDPAAPGGYVSLPGNGDPHYQSNTASIWHGVEGKWFRSSHAWETLMRPLIEAATARRSAQR